MDDTPKVFDLWTIPVALGTIGAAGFLLGRIIKNENKSASEILTKVKKYFLSEGQIEGSWIESTKIPYNKFAFKTLAYRGGISRYEDQDLVSYEFLADAKTGTVLNIKRI